MHNCLIIKRDAQLLRSASPGTIRRLEYRHIRYLFARDSADEATTLLPASIKESGRIHEEHVDSTKVLVSLPQLSAL